MSKRKRKHGGMATVEELLQLNRLFLDALMREIAREKPRMVVIGIARDVLREAGITSAINCRAKQIAALESLGAATREALSLPFAAKLKDR